MKAVGYLYVSSRGSMRVSKRPADVSPDEVRLTLEVEIPTAYFQRPEPRVRLELEVPDPPSDPAVVRIGHATVSAHEVVPPPEPEEEQP